MPIRRVSAQPLLTGVCSVLLALACNSRGSPRIAAPDAAPTGDSSMAEVELGGSGGVEAGPADVGEAGSPGGNSTEAGQPAYDGGLDLSVGGGDNHDGGLDSPLTAGEHVDGGPDGGGTFQCNFPGSPNALSCADGEYCSSFMAGIPTDGGPFYSCVPFTGACLADRSCACVCSPVNLYPGWLCPSRPGGPGNYCQCIVNQGSLVLLCGAP